MFWNVFKKYYVKYNNYITKLEKKKTWLTCNLAKYFSCKYQFSKKQLLQLLNLKEKNLKNSPFTSSLSEITQLNMEKKLSIPHFDECTFFLTLRHLPTRSAFSPQATNWGCNMKGNDFFFCPFPILYIVNFSRSYVVYKADKTF